MRTVIIWLGLLFCSAHAASGASIEEITYRRLQATPDKYVGKPVVITCAIRKYIAERTVLEADCDKEQTGGPCI